jgi:glycosyltransferase involved in cell wall biosynthesis
LLLGAHVFLQHSVTAQDGNTEGWPVGIAEACATGLPVVSTQHAGIPEQIIHGKTGFLVPEHDIERMGKHMLQLSQNLALCRSMGHAGRVHMQEHGDINRQIEKLSLLLNKAIS